MVTLSFSFSGSIKYRTFIIFIITFHKISEYHLLTNLFPTIFFTLKITFNLINLSLSNDLCAVQTETGVYLLGYNKMTRWTLCDHFPLDFSMPSKLPGQLNVFLETRRHV